MPRQASSPPGKRTGRPPGSPPNRQSIIEAARLLFSELGYSGATIRRIAASAGVDPALVHHYFGSKDHLLVAAMQPQIAQHVTDLLQGSRRGIGAAFLRRTLHAYEITDSGGWRTMVGLLRSATTHADAAGVLREYATSGGVAQLLEALNVPQPQLRAALVVSELAGLAMARYVLRLEPVASADIESVIAWYGPVLQRFLVGPLPGDSDAPMKPD